MDDATLVAEAQALATRLNNEWDSSERGSLRRERLVTLAQRAYYRHIRRAAHSGDLLAQQWLMFSKETILQ